MVVPLLFFAEPKYFVGILGGGLSADNRSLLRLCIYPGRAVSSGRGCSARPRNDDRRSLGPRRVCRNSYGSLKGTIRIDPHDICCLKKLATGKNNGFRFRWGTRTG